MTTTTSIKLDDELKNRVQRLAEARPWSPQWIIHEAIREYVDRETAHENFKREAVTAWAAYLETGKHLTGEQVQTWLRTWGTDDEPAAPGIVASS